MGESPPPILFWPSESWPIVPVWPPAAVSSKEHEDLGTTRAEAPRASESVIKEYIIANVLLTKVILVVLDCYEIGLRGWHILI